MPLDPQAAAYLDQVTRLGVPSAYEVPLAHARAGYSSAARDLFGTTDPVEAIEDMDADGVPVRVYRPRGRLDADAHGALVYAHGGGWVIGDLDSHDPLCRQLAAQSGCTVVSVDYRLAPEHPYPAAVEDVWTATRWAAERFSPLAIGGDSAGGQLAASVALRARDAGLPLVLQVLIYPATDHEAPQESIAIDGPPLTWELMTWFWSQYVTDPASAADPDLSPMRAPSVQGVAPALVLTAEFDLLMPQGEAYARRLESEGVPAQLRRYDGLVHGFIRMPAVIERAQEAIELIADSLRGAMAEQQA